jgi:hypothetical protein
MSGNDKENRVKLMRELHGHAAMKWNIEDPHPLLHQLSAAEFEVESMAHLSNQELRLLDSKIQADSIDWKKVENLGVTKIPGMSAPQLYLVGKLRKELGWSEEYLIELAIKRYGYLHYKYLTGRPSVAYVGYLIKRRKEKLNNEKPAKRSN